MEKVDLHTTDTAAENAAKLAELFPDIVTEVMDKDGNLCHSIDVEALKAHVGDVAEDKRERYQFTWPGKQRARAEAIRAIDKTMRPCKDKSVNWDTTQNLYIEGDNLDALKILRETYAGKIKMIYIDPPYNTGDDYLYLDRFIVDEESFLRSSGAVDEDGRKLVHNTDRYGRFHSYWCSTLHSRLLLARDMLASDGIILISIDARELSNLQSIANEVFGQSNCLGILVWESKTKCQNTSTAKRQLQAKQEYILVYRKNNQRHEFNLNVVAERQYDRIDENGTPYRVRMIEQMSSSGIRGRDSMIYPILGVMPEPGKQWKIGREQCEAYADRGDLFLDNGVPSYRCRPEDEDAKMDPFWSLMQTKEVGTAETAKRELNALVGQCGFETVKPVGLLKKLVNHVVSPDEGGVILDFFSGSATTAHAVMKLNAEDGGNRTFIMVQLPEVCDEKSEAAKAGYKNICEIGEERIRRAGKKIAEDLEPGQKVPDIGFRVFKIDSSNFEDVTCDPDTLVQDSLFGMADNLKPDRSAEDILYQLLPRYQIPYSAPVEKLDVCGKTVYNVNDGDLLACFDRDVPEEVIRTMAQMEPTYAVMRDASFAGDDTLSNFAEIFKTLSKETVIKVV